MLKLDNIAIELGNFALKADVQFAAPITALIGPSGAGKSTVLNVIAGFVEAAHGRVLWQGDDISHVTPAERPAAMLFQDNNIFPHLSVSNNIALGLTSKRPTQAEQEQIRKALGRVGLAGYEERMPSTLSGGQQSRVALARVLLQNRPIMLLDEPFAALGPALKDEMLDLVAQVSAEENMQIIMVSHDPRDALRIAGVACVVADGGVTSPMATDRLLSNPPPALAEYLGSQNYGIMRS